MNRVKSKTSKIGLLSVIMKDLRLSRHCSDSRKWLSVSLVCTFSTCGACPSVSGGHGFEPALPVCSWLFAAECTRIFKNSPVGAAVSIASARLHPSLI